MHKYWGYFLMELSRAKLYWLGTIVGAVLIGLRLILPYSIFAILVSNHQITWATANIALWGVLIGQLLNNADIRLHRKIKYEVRNGDIVVRLSDPGNFIFAKLFQAFGYFTTMVLTNSLIFIPIFILFIPASVNLFWLFSFTLLSFILYSLINIIVGLSSFLIEENSGVELIVSKLFFIFGNQVIPMILMPLWVQSFAKWTPFYLGLAGPIEVATGRLAWQFALILSLIYIVIFYGLAQLMLSIVRRRLVVNG